MDERDPIAQRDQQLADILTQLTDLHSDARPNLEELTAAFPHLTEEVRELWGTAMIVDAVADWSANDALAAKPKSASDELLLPKHLGDFELCEEIGRGGMGIVYRARQLSLGRDVAVKVMLRGARATPEEQARFQAEVAAAAQLDHPNIVPIYEVGTHEGCQYFGMKLVEGQTLAEKMAAGPLPESEAVQLMITIAQAIHYAHQRGVIHRDLKPANILIKEKGLIEKKGQPYVSDFGLAKQTTSSAAVTQTGAILGTPSYMSPEQAASDRGLVGPVSDVYSLGAILYALLTGRPPHQGASPVDTVLMVLEQDPVPPRLLNPQVNRDLEMIVLRCLQKPGDLRYASAGQLADDLQAFAAGEPISARSGQFAHVVARVFRDTPHANVLENWGLLWMWHAVVRLVLCLVTNWFSLRREAWPMMKTPWPYLALWGGGLTVWAPIFWSLRRRGTTRRSRLGRQYCCGYLAVCDRILARHASACVITRSWLDQRNGFRRESRDIVWHLLYSCGSDVCHGTCHGSSTTLAMALWHFALRRCRSGKLFYPRLEVLSTEPKESPVTANSISKHFTFFAVDVGPYASDAAVGANNSANA